jgi:hypothetical protein
MTTSPTAVQPIPRGGMARLVGRRLTDWIPAVVVFVGTIALWEGLIRAFDVQEFLLPKPSAIASTFWNTRGQLWSQGWFTFQEALGGFLLGSAFAILVALFFARFRVLGTAFMPYAIAANAIPIIAFAPITNVWFSPLEKSSKISIAAVLCFFPARPRADGVVRRRAGADLQARPHSDGSAVYLHRTEGGDGAGHDRRRRRRIFRRGSERFRRADP